MYTRDEVISILENIDKNLMYDTWKSAIPKINLYIEEIEKINISKKQKNFKFKNFYQ